ncbi:MAG: hypothetical protein QXJ06_03700, partial [Candidatus Aenigmatarchaeota archaeon]
MFSILCVFLIFFISFIERTNSMNNIETLQETYLIITSPAIQNSNALDNFISCKQKQGFNVQIV